MIVKNALVFTESAYFRMGDVYMDGGLFTDNISTDGLTLDADGLYAIPGLIDIHFHGCMGSDFCDGTPQALDTISSYELENGITGICPASMTLPEETLARVFSNARTYQASQGASLLGINMEGPFLSSAKKGAQNEAFLHLPDIDMFHRLQKEAGGLIRLAAIAPELEEASLFIRTLKDEVILSLAHTNADYDTAASALSLGASHITHLYNAMAPFSHRAPGVPGAAFDKKDTYVELICDGIHVHPSAVRSAFSMYTDNRIVLISDSMMAAGMPDGIYSLGGQQVQVSGRRALLKDGTIAGSASNLMDCVRTAVLDMGIPLESAVKCASANPARSIGVYDSYGSISAGKCADLVLLDKNLAIVNVIKSQVPVF